MKNLIKYMFFLMMINTSNAQYVIHDEILDSGAIYAFTFTEDQNYCVFVASTQCKYPGPDDCACSNYQMKRFAITFIVTDLKFNVVYAISYMPGFCNNDDTDQFPYCKQNIFIYDIIASNGYYYLCGERGSSNLYGERGPSKAFIMRVSKDFKDIPLSRRFYLEFDEVKSFYSICSNNEDLFVVGQSMDDKGCCYCFHTTDTTISYGYGYKTINNDWQFHKVIDKNDYITMSGTNGISTGFVTLNANGVNSTIHTSKQFQNSVQNKSRSVLTKCPGNMLHGFILATSDNNQIRTFVFDDSVYVSGKIYTDPYGRPLYLQDINYSEDDVAQIAWVGTSECAFGASCFYLRSLFNFNNLQAPFFPPFYNQYIDIWDFYLYKTHYNYVQDQFYCGGYTTNDCLNKQETFCAIPEVSSPSCDNLGDVSEEDNPVIDIQDLPLIQHDVLFNDVGFQLCPFNLHYERTCEDNTTQKMKNSVYQLENENIIDVYVLGDNIHISEIPENANYIIYSVDGRKIKESKLNSNLVLINDLSKGIYLFNIVGKGINITKKIIK